MNDFSLLPKVELHVHLDCALSYKVVAKIATSITEIVYQNEFIAPKKCIDLADFLKRAVRGFVLMQTKEQLEWVVDDLFEQLQQDHVIYAEIRFAPLQHLAGGLTTTEVVAITDAAVSAAIQRTGIEARLILCTLRHFTEAQSMETVQLVQAFKGTNVVGFDIAADEAGFPVTAHISAFEYAHNHQIPCTAHAGEAKGAESVWETLQCFRPSRIGHGVRSIEDPQLVNYLKKHKIHLEVCPTCNIQINLFEHFKDHPVDALYKAGVSLSINTDARTITNTHLNGEYESLQQHFGWTIADFYRCSKNGMLAAFINEPKKLALLDKLWQGYAPYLSSDPTTE